MTSSGHTHDHDHQTAHDGPAGDRRRDTTVDAMLAHGLPAAAGNAAVADVVAQRRAAETSPPDHGAMVAQAISGGGQNLEAATRSSLEQHTGHDLSGVRIHTGAAASQAAASLGSEAFTVGSNIVFGAGQFDTSSASGIHRLAHEATHVVQQRSGPVSATDTGTGVALSDPNDAFEQAAEASAAEFTRRRSGG